MEASKRSVVGMAYRPTSKVRAPLKTSWFPSRTRTPWKTRSGAFYWFQCGDLAHDEESIGETSRTFWRKIQRTYYYSR